MNLIFKKKKNCFNKSRIALEPQMSDISESSNSCEKNYLNKKKQTVRKKSFF